MPTFTEYMQNASPEKRLGIYVPPDLRKLLVQSFEKIDKTFRPVIVELNDEIQKDVKHKLNGRDYSIRIFVNSVTTSIKIRQGGQIIQYMSSPPLQPRAPNQLKPDDPSTKLMREMLEIYYGDGSPTSYLIYVPRLDSNHGPVRFYASSAQPLGSKKRDGDIDLWRNTSASQRIIDAVIPSVQQSASLLEELRLS